MDTNEIFNACWHNDNGIQCRIKFEIRKFRALCKNNKVPLCAQ